MSWFRRRKPSTPDVLPWADWRDQDAERVADERLIRPSISLPVDLVATVDRVAEQQDMTRSELVQHVLSHYLASWRPPHRPTPCPEGSCDVCDDRRAQQWSYVEGHQ